MSAAQQQANTAMSSVMVSVQQATSAAQQSMAAMSGSVGSMVVSSDSVSDSVRGMSDSLEFAAFTADRVSNRMSKAGAAMVGVGSSTDIVATKVRNVGMAYQTAVPVLKVYKSSINDVTVSTRMASAALQDLAQDQITASTATLSSAESMKKVATSSRALQSSQKKTTKNIQVFTSSLNQATFGVQDFIQVYTQPGLGFTAALRASANNLQQVAAIGLPSLTRALLPAKLAGGALAALLPGLTAVVVGLGLAIVPIIANLFDFGESAKDAKKEIEDLKDAVKDLADFTAKLNIDTLKITLGSEKFQINQIKKELAEMLQPLAAEAQIKAAEATEQLDKIEATEARVRALVRARGGTKAEADAKARGATVGERRALLETTSALDKLNDTISKAGSAAKDAITDIKDAFKSKDQEADESLAKFHVDLFEKNQKAADKILAGSPKGQKEALIAAFRELNSLKAKGFLDSGVGGDAGDRRAVQIAAKAAREAFVKARLAPIKGRLAKQAKADKLAKLDKLSDAKTTFKGLGDVIQKNIFKNQQLKEQQKTNIELEKHRRRLDKIAANTAKRTLTALN